eukprot:TRINITY_DN67897_c0_g1_i1.p1 TRINITY_DN67897_c0_g1~~TRINITY_DN67897_c0_g1_i1.p1  ORF type:complete len:734 (-),score=66.86 TRINITY_DN67897_c0_g1_i1:162-2303(-)
MEHVKGDLKDMQTILDRLVATCDCLREKLESISATVPTLPRKQEQEVDVDEDVVPLPASSIHNVGMISIDAENEGDGTSAHRFPLVLLDDPSTEQLPLATRASEFGLCSSLMSRNFTTVGLPLVQAEKMASDQCRPFETRLSDAVASNLRRSVFISSTSTQKCLAHLSTAQSEDASFRPLPVGKSYHYFLSHKKHHSRVGEASEHVATSLHDSLEATGYKGFLDIDTLAVISNESIREAIKGSCVLLVVLSDETVTSRWCTLEWEIAEAEDLEVQVIIDCQRFVKKDVLASVKDYPVLLKHQWIEYTDRVRRRCFSEVDRWCQGKIKSQKHVLAGFDSVEEFLTPFVRLLLLVSATPYRSHHLGFGSYMHAWVWLARLLALASLGLIFSGVHVSSGVIHNYPVAVGYIIATHLQFFYSSFVVSGALRSQVTRMFSMFQAIGGSECVLQQMRRSTHIFSLCGCVFCAMCSTSVIVIYGLLRVRSLPHGSYEYLDFCLFMCLSGAALVVVAGCVAMLVHLHLASALMLAIFEAAFEVLDHRIGMMGVSSFLEARSGIFPHDASVIIFRTFWIEACACYTTLQANTSMAMIIHFLLHSLGLTVPFWFFYVEKQHLPRIDVLHLGSIVVWWLFAVGSYVTAVLLPCVFSVRMNNLRTTGRLLNFASPEHQSRFDQLMSMDLSWSVGPFQISSAVAFVLLIPVVVSAASLVQLASSSR